MEAANHILGSRTESLRLINAGFDPLFSLIFVRMRKWKKPDIVLGRDPGGSTAFKNTFTPSNHRDSRF